MIDFIDKNSFVRRVYLPATMVGKGLKMIKFNKYIKFGRQNDHPTTLPSSTRPNWN